MDVRKKLLNAARLLALTGIGAAGGQATAATPPSHLEAESRISTTQRADPLFEVMQRTKGSLSATALEPVIRDMFANPTDQEAEAMAGLLTNLRGLGAGSEALARVRAVMDELIEDAASIREDIRRTILDQFEEGSSAVKLAQADEDRRRRLRRDRDELGQTGAPASAS